MRALALVMMGHLDQADAASAKAVELSEQLGHKPSIAQTLQFRAEYCLILDRWDDAAAAVKTCRSLSQQFSLGNYLDYANLMQGWVCVVQGDAEDGLRQAEAALKVLKSVPSRRFHMPIRIGSVGRAKAAAGDIKGALALFDEAIDEVPITGERWYEPELRRFKAEMLLAETPPRVAEAEQCLLAAVAVAREQEARLWELRAATALAELWARQGKGPHARDLLAPVHLWFAEGLDGPDMRRAAKVLAGLP
jgi:predicted ATPase